jgi:hypothetical protein
MARGLGMNRRSTLASQVRSATSGLKAKPLNISPLSQMKGVALGGAAGAGAGAFAGNKATKPKKPKVPGAITKSGHDAFISKGIKTWKPPSGFKNKKNALVGNLTSKRTKNTKGETIGRPPHLDGDQENQAITNTVLGAAAGAAAASFSPKGRDAYRKQMHSDRLGRQINNNKAKLKKIEKRYTRITDAGTLAARRWPQAHKMTAVTVGGVAGGAALTEGSNRLAGKGYEKRIKNQKKILARQKTQLAKSKPMSDAELRRRKKLQGHISQTTGVLGLTSLAAFGASKVPGSKVMAKTPKLRRIANRIDTKKAENIALGTSTTGAGIGGAGSFNFAAYTNAESRKRKQGMTTVKKNSVSAFGVDHD